MPLLILFGLNLTDELDRSAFGILLPEIRDDFNLDNSGILGLVALSAAAALLLTVPIAAWADRSNRVRIALLGAAAWACFSVGTGMAFAAWFLVVMRSGSAIGQAVNFPTHNSLLSDYYEPKVRPRIYSLHRSANAIGTVGGAVIGAALAQVGSWRTPFFVFAVPTLVLVVARRPSAATPVGATTSGPPWAPTPTSSTWTRPRRRSPRRTGWSG